MKGGILLVIVAAICVFFVLKAIIDAFAVPLALAGTGYLAYRALKRRRASPGRPGDGIFHS